MNLRRRSYSRSRKSLSMDFLGEGLGIALRTKEGGGCSPNSSVEKKRIRQQDLDKGKRISRKRGDLSTRKRQEKTSFEEERAFGEHRRKGKNDDSKKKRFPTCETTEESEAGSLKQGKKKGKRPEELASSRTRTPPLHSPKRLRKSSCLQSKEEGKRSCPQRLLTSINSGIKKSLPKKKPSEKEGKDHIGRKENQFINVLLGGRKKSTIGKKKKQLERGLRGKSDECLLGRKGQPLKTKRTEGGRGGLDFKKREKKGKVAQKKKTNAFQDDPREAMRNLGTGEGAGLWGEGRTGGVEPLRRKGKRRSTGHKKKREP